MRAAREFLKSSSPPDFSAIFGASASFGFSAIFGGSDLTVAKNLG
jgi:hypothetical protein